MSPSQGPHFAIDASLPQIKQKFKEQPNLILSASPGTGKTTRVPCYLLDAGIIAPDKEILVLQPRRVAAKQTALYMAKLRSQPIGQDIGYIIRFDSKIGPRTRIKVLTEAILNRMIEEEPELPNVGMVILDEFHERSIHTDVALALLKEIQASIRPDLKILVMSATLDHTIVQKYLPDCGYLHVEAKQFEVNTLYEGPSLKPSAKPFEIAGRVSQAIHKHLEHHPLQGDILAFLPGVGEIKKTSEACRSLAGKYPVEICELHSQVTQPEQDRLFQPHPKNLHRLILATNIAETSITLEGIDTVIDSGLMKELTIDPQFGIEKLQLMRISKQNAEQRKGRAGRVRAGLCVRLWSKDDQLHLNEAPQPDVRRIDLKSTLLLLSSMGNYDFTRFDWFERPPEPHLKRDLQFLTNIGAINRDGRLSSFGQKMSRLGYINPRHAAFVCRSLEQGATIEFTALCAVLLENLDSFQLHAHGSTSSEAHESDLLALFEQEKSNFYHSNEQRPLVPQHLFQLFLRLKRDAGKIFPAAPTEKSPSAATAEKLSSQYNVTGLSGFEAISNALLWAFYDRLCRRRAQKSEGTMVGGRGVLLDIESECKKSPYFIAFDPFEHRSQNVLVAKASVAHGFTFDDLKAILGERIKTERKNILSPGSRKLQIMEVTCFEDLELVDPKPALLTADESKELSVKNQFQDAETFFKDRPKLQKILTRICYLHFHASDKFSPEIGTLSFEKILEHFAQIARDGLSFDQEESKLIPQLMPLILTPQEWALLNREAPHQLQVPSGSFLPLQYSPADENKPPQLDVRLQEIFGLGSTPKLCFGKVPLLINLLSPAYKSVQVTRDLESFWTNAYFEIRKELKAQYPRHLWPENPKLSPAQSKGGIKRGSDF